MTDPEERVQYSTPRRLQIPTGFYTLLWVLRAIETCKLHCALVAKAGNGRASAHSGRTPVPGLSALRPESLVASNMLEVTGEVIGASELMKWFGYWPSFHDAEVLDVELHRTGDSTVRIHTFEMTNDVDTQGFFVCTKHVVVDFVLQGLNSLHLDHFNTQNVISGLDLKQTAEGFELALDGCYGVEGTLTAERISIRIQPGPPIDSQYRTVAQP